MRRLGWLLLVGGLAPAYAQDEVPAPAAKPRPAMIAPLAPSSTLLGIASAGERLVAVGQRGHILLSDDGKDWRQVAAPVNVMLNRVRFRDAKRGWAVGHDATILATVDGGETWSLQQHDPAGRALYDVLFLDGDAMAVIGGYGSYYGSADGTTWEARSFPVSELGQHFSAATRLGDGTLLMVGERGLLTRSRDGGQSWELLESPYTGSFFGVLPHGEKGALAFGLRGNLYVAEDIGACPAADPLEYDPFTRETVTDAAQLTRLGWRHLPAPTTEGLFGGTADGDRALLVGVNGVRLRVDLAGNTAVLIEGPALETLNDVLSWRGQWLAVGRRGVQNLGALP